MSRVYVYVVARDFGFAPNPFHGYCTLATCKPRIRSTAHVDDWVVGMGGSRLRARGRCVFAMRVTETLTFNEYWSNPIYFDKRPVRNGSRKMMVGDNIYHYDSAPPEWHQEDSHHSNVDGSINPDNLRTDTQADKVLISRYFFYFGTAAPIIPEYILTSIGFKNRIGHRVFDFSECVALIEWLHTNFAGSLNTIQADPFDFDKSDKRYSARNNKIF